MSRWLVAMIGVCWLVSADARVVPDASRTLAAADLLRAVQEGGLSLAQATEAALRTFPGRVARAETVERGGRRVHEIRILGEDGRVRSFRFDAASGRPL